jgi:hypothetical protein
MVTEPEVVAVVSIALLMKSVIDLVDIDYTDVDNIKDDEKFSKIPRVLNNERKNKIVHLYVGIIEIVNNSFSSYLGKLFSNRSDEIKGICFLIWILQRV